MEHTDRKIPAYRLNNFDILRLLSATGVLFAHSFVLFGLEVQPYKPTGNLLTDFFGNLWVSFKLNAGSLGVDVFFVISGYLITKSILSDPKQWSYWKKRCLRIFPALIVLALFSAFVTGSIFTKMPLTNYLTHPDTIFYLTSISIYKIPDILPGLWLDHPKLFVNGSLWTLRYELTCYIIVAVFSFIGIIGKKWCVLGFMVVMVLCGGLIQIYYPLPPKIEFILIYTDLALSHLSYLLTVFSVGMVYALFKNEIQLKWWMALSAFLFMMVITGFPELGINIRFAYPVLAGIIIFYISFIPIPQAISHPFGNNDYSYGIYIYGMPAQQIVYALFGSSIGIFWYNVFGILLSFGLGALSWHFVEKKALAFKPKA